MTMRFPSLPAILLALGAFATPAAAQDNGVAPPGMPPPASFFIDSAAAVRALAALPAVELPEGLPPLFALTFDSTGAVERAEGVFQQLPAAFTGPVSSIIRAHARRQMPSSDPPGTYLRIVTGAGAVIERPSFVRWTQPAAINAAAIARRLEPVVVRRMEAVGPEGVRLHVGARVLADGTVDTASVKVVGTSGDDELDRQTALAFRQMRFRPATVEGIPVSAWVTVPFRLLLDAGYIDVRVMRAGRVSARVPLSALADSAALAAAVSALPPLAFPETTLFRIHFDTAGAVRAIEGVYSQLPPAAARALAEAIRPHLRKQPSSPQPLQLLLRVVPGPDARVERTALAEVSPVLANEGGIRRLVREAAAQHAGGRLTADLLLAVDADGAADPATIGYLGRAPAPALASALAEIVGQMRFRPGQVGGYPARTWIRIPLRIGQR
ncbi:MAG TPA: TonB family protein [Longimicrobium sp.]|nr:TonB family protein [Longimicrobium sp.]